MPVTIGPSTVTINHDRQFLVCHRDATVLPSGDLGFYAHDTRFLSGYGVTLNGRPPLLLDATAVEHFSARHEFMTPELTLSPGAEGGEDGVLAEGSVGFRIERSILEGVHEDYDLTSYASRPVRLILEIAIESDFADVFDVRARRIIRRGDIQTTWGRRIAELRTSYRNRTFRRGLTVKVDKPGSPPGFANGRLVFTCEIAPRTTWHVCLLWLPVIGEHAALTLPCHTVTSAQAKINAHPLPPVELITSHATLPAIWRQARIPDSR